MVVAIYYRPQRSWAKVMFLQASVILSTGGGEFCLSACWDTPGTRPPRTPPGPHPPEPDPPGPDTHPQPPGPEPPQEQTPPVADTHPPREADSGIRSTNGRYASYWNAFLLLNLLTLCQPTISYCPKVKIHFLVM